MITKASLLFFLILVLCSCSEKEPAVVGHFYKNSYSVNSDRKVDLENFKSNGRLRKESFLDFFADGSYVIYMNQLESGEYIYRNDSIFLESDDGLKWDLVFHHAEGLGHFQFPNAEAMSSLHKIENNMEEAYTFSRKKNEWRRIPRRSMNNNELLLKFQNYCEFMISYMRWAKKKGLNLSMKHMSGPIKYANNGLMMLRLSEAINWCDYFYPGDCERMDKILRNYFDGLIIDWRYTHDRIAMLSNGLEQIIKGIENQKEHFE